MTDFNYLDIYDGTPVHDGLGDFDYSENSSELPGLFDDTYIDQYIDTLNDWN